MSATVRHQVTLTERLRAHLAIARLDHSIKNLFVLPGIIVPLSVYPSLFNQRLVLRLLLALIAITLVASSNYVINEVLDAPCDRLHPIKHNRPAARGLVSVPRRLRAMAPDDARRRGHRPHHFTHVRTHGPQPLDHGLPLQLPTRAH